MDGDEVVVAPATYIENIHIEQKDITLRSSDGPLLTIIVALINNDPVIRVQHADLVIDGFTMTSPWVFPNNSGLLYVTGDSSLVISNCVFTDTVKTKGISMGGGNLTITGCMFSGLGSNSNGSGLAYGGNGDLTRCCCCSSC